MCDVTFSRNWGINEVLDALLMLAHDGQIVSRKNVAARWPINDISEVRPLGRPKKSNGTLIRNSDGTRF